MNLLRGQIIAGRGLKILTKVKKGVGPVRGNPCRYQTVLLSLTAMHCMKRLFAILLPVLLASCGKDDPVAKDVQTLLTQAPWTLTGEYQRHATLPIWGTNNWFPQPCEADNRYVFYQTGGYEINEGAEKCSSGAPQTILSAQWAFTRPDKELIVNGEYFVIDQITENTLVLTFRRLLGTRVVDLKRDFVR
jgi:hypothetical protein